MSGKDARVEYSQAKKRKTHGEEYPHVENNPNIPNRRVSTTYQAEEAPPPSRSIVTAEQKKTQLGTMKELYYMKYRPQTTTLPRQIRQDVQHKYCDMELSTAPGATISRQGTLLQFANIYESTGMNNPIQPAILEGANFYERVGERITVTRIRGKFFPFVTATTQDTLRLQVILDKQWNGAADPGSTPSTGIVSCTKFLDGFQQIPYFNRYKVLYDEIMVINPTAVGVITVAHIQFDLKVNIPIQYQNAALSATSISSQSIQVLAYSWTQSIHFNNTTPPATGAAPPGCLRFYFVDK